MWPYSAKQIYEIIKNSTCNIPQFSNILIYGLCHDSRKLNAMQMFIALKGEYFDGHNYVQQCLQQGAVIAIVQENNPVLNNLSIEEKERCIYVDDPTVALRKLAKAMRQNFNFPILAIGGSNGKTTTKEMLYSMLLGPEFQPTKTAKSENGYLGLAFTLLQEKHNQANPPTELVLEIGIDEIGAMQQHLEIAAPNIVMLTALGPEHLLGLQNWENACQEELILFSEPTDIKIWQLADPKIREYYLSELKNNKLNSNRNYLVIPQDEYINYIEQNKLTDDVQIIWQITHKDLLSSTINLQIKHMDHNEKFNYLLQMPGSHNVANFALAFAAALAAGRNIDQITTGLKQFIPPPMRSNLTMLKNGIYLLNDAYNASPFSMQAALEIMLQEDMQEKNKLIILGDMLGLGQEAEYWHRELIPLLRRLKNTQLCLYGEEMAICYKILYQDNLFAQNNLQINYLDSAADPKEFLAKIQLEIAIILVKGSRAMKLERVIETFI